MAARRTRRGKRRITGDVVLVVVTIAAVVVAAGLLNRVAREASSINDHAEAIAGNTRGINGDTSAIHQLGRTNQLAASILESAAPLDPGLGRTVELAGAIDANAGAIESSARSINESVGEIGATAASIEQHAGSIMATAESINGTATQIKDTSGSINSISAAVLATAGYVDADVRQINIHLNKTISIVRSIRDGTRQLVEAGLITHKEAACIDQEIKLLGSGYNGDQFCRYQPGGGARGH